MSSDQTVHNLIMGTAGHIDHGKTSLIRALTGIDTDRLPEEKSRGITIDIGFAKLDLGDLHLGIVDVPGHERFVKNMLAGAVGIDVAMLVIAADDSIMPQTREHLYILQMLDIRYGLIALTKTDLVDADWLELVQDDIASFVKGTFLERAPLVRTAVAHGQITTGGEELRNALRQVCSRIQPRPANRILRLPVDRAFGAHGVGTVVTGTVWSGQLKAGEEVEWLPRQVPIRVRSVQSHGCEQASGQGQRAAANLIGVHHEEIRRGHELATAGFLKPSKRLLAQFRVLDDSPFPVKHRGRYRLHVGTQELMVRVALLSGSQVEPGGQALAQLICAQPVIALCGQPLVLRMESPVLTLGGGHVLQPAPQRFVRRARWKGVMLERLCMLGSMDPEDRAAAATYFFGVQQWTILDLCRDANLLIEQATTIAQKFLDDGIVVHLTLGSRIRVVHRDVLAEIEAQAIAALNVLHESHPLETGIHRTLLAAKMKRLCDAPLLGAVLDRLIQHGRIRGDGQTVMIAKHAPTLTDQQIKLREQILSAYATAGMAPPSSNELTTQLGAKAGSMRQLLNLCVEHKQLVHLGAGWYLTTDAESSMRQKVIAALRGKSDGITMSQLREVMGTTRKYAVPFAEYLDRIGVTKRHGDVRLINES